jgi:hypothetical protein
MTSIRSVTPAQAAASSPATSQNPVITQEQLARYAELCALARERDRLRRELMDLMAAGASVEGGRLTVRVHTIHARQLSFRALQGIFTPPDVEWIRSLIEPTISRRLIVEQDPYHILRLY